MIKNNNLIFEDTPWDLVAGLTTSISIGIINQKTSKNSLDPPFYN
jgi:hypothetical protein